MLEYKVAKLSDIEATLKLHAKYQVDTINPKDKKDGFVTTPFNKEELAELIEKERGLFIAKDGDEVVAYVMSASWEFWSKWPMFAFMAQNLEGKSFKGIDITKENSYQYGPIAIDRRYRGTEVLYNIFDFARENMAKKYPILITFVNKINTRSFNAHKKLGLKVLSEFEYNNNHYFEMVYDTSVKVKRVK